MNILNLISDFLSISPTFRQKIYISKLQKKARPSPKRGGILVLSLISRQLLIIQRIFSV